MNELSLSETSMYLCKALSLPLFSLLL